MEVIEKELIVISKLHKVLVLKEVEMWLLFWADFFICLETANWIVTLNTKAKANVHLGKT